MGLYHIVIAQANITRHPSIPTPIPRFADNGRIRKKKCYRLNKN